MSEAYTTYHEAPDGPSKPDGAVIIRALELVAGGAGTAEDQEQAARVLDSLELKKPAGAKLSPLEYLGEDGSHCPYCDTWAEYDGDSIEVDAGRITQRIFCNACHRSYYDNYVLLGYLQPFEDANEPDEHQPIPYEVT